MSKKKNQTIKKLTTIHKQIAVHRVENPLLIIMGSLGKNVWNLVRSEKKQPLQVSFGLETPLRLESSAL